ncbi:MAG: transposase [Chitinophagaceae bacterium]|nr:MAG: transposase [Chitinophagaceae bacterium]
MTKEEEVIGAVQSYLRGEPVIHILRQYKCSKSWLYKWVSRYKTNPQGDWYIEQSRKPKNVSSTITEQERQTVIYTRRSLEDRPYSQRGAISIQYELNANGHGIIPVWKINKILANAGLNKKEPKNSKRVNEYPLAGLVTDQMDFVGPRYIKNDGRFYSLNIIDCSTHYARVNIIRSMETENVLTSVVRFWQQRGMPDFIQMDNGLSFRGSNRYPRSFGQLIRLALSLHITPLFIPMKEPWRNGIIEKFNDSFNKRFLKSRIYENFEHLTACSKEFEQFHNTQHRYSIHHNRTPAEQQQMEYERDLLTDEFVIPKSKIDITHGKIILVRFIRSNLILNIFGEKFLMPKHLMYSYVRAVIDVESQFLGVIRDGQLHWKIPYTLV